MTPTLAPSTLHVADLPASERAWLLAQRYDRSLEKHEGPWDWEDQVEPEPYEVPERGGVRRTVQPVAADFVRVADRHVLLPVSADCHVHLRVLRVIEGDGGASLVLFMTDTTYDEGAGAGRLAVCDRAPDADWYLCHVWHEWYDPAPTPDP